MNIGIVTTWHEGGAGYVSRAYRNSLLEAGHTVLIYARGGRYYPIGDPIWDIPDVTWGIRYRPSKRMSSFTSQYVNLIHFEAWLRKNNIDVVITNEDHSFQFAKRVKRLGYCIGTYIDYYKRDTIGCFEIFDFLLCNTRRHYSVFSDFQNALYIPWGTDLELYRPRREKNYSHSDGAVVFFHSAGYGGVNGRKGTDLLLEAFQKVTGPARLIVHSQAPLSKFGEAATEIVMGDERIEFIQRTVPAPGLYHLGDVFVYPSRLEGIGLCIPEALASGLPVITTDNAPMNEFVHNGVNGRLVRVSSTHFRADGYFWPEKVVDIEDLTRQMQLYVNQPEILRLQQRRAREYAESSLEWDNNVSQLSSLLESIFNASQRLKRRPSVFERIFWSAEAAHVGTLTGIRKAGRFIFRR